ncbi:MAG: low specificity L-threonine aldolase [Chloroflexi bacterium]|nr:MAG: low specificity L-threonine aldolase [Chloroflexota bacterium]
MPDRLIDLISDTATKPTPAMRQAMYDAPVGDDMMGEDPTVNLLEAMSADLLGKEAAVFLSSGTMCNLIGILLHTRPGDEVILEAHNHPYTAEGGGAAAFGGVSFHLIQGTKGFYTAQQVLEAINPDDQHYARSAMVSLENATGGRVWPFEQFQDVARTAHANGLKTHTDGARLMNAVVASGISAREWVAEMDTAWIDLSKGLGAPVGGVLAGTAKDMAQARRYRKMLGGAMRQAGVIAAAGVYALQHNIERLAEDHANAKRLAEGLAEIPGIRIDPADVETNLVFFDTSDTGLTPAEISAGLLERGVRMGGWSPRFRAVTHLDISTADIDIALEAMREVVVG